MENFVREDEFAGGLPNSQDLSRLDLNSNSSYPNFIILISRLHWVIKERSILKEKFKRKDARSLIKV